MKNLPPYTDKISRHPTRYFQQFTDRLTAEGVRDSLSQVLEEILKADSASDWEAAINFWNEVKSHIQTHFELVELSFQCHTDEEDYEKEERRLKETIDPVFDEWNAKIREKVLASPFLKELKDKFGNQYFVLLTLQQDAFDPRNISLETKLNQVLADYTKLTGGAHFELDGKKFPVSHYKKFANSSDERVRRESFLAFSNWYLQHRDPLEKIFDQSLQFRDQMGKNLGHANFIPLGYQKMRRTDYGHEEVGRLREQIHAVMVPLARRIREKQARSLGVKEVSIWNSDYFPDWKIGEMKVAVADQPKTALKIYQRLSPVLGAHFKRMMDYQLIDLEARDGKGPGAFCTDFSDYRVPFIFLNSVNEASDVTTMLHECGHSFQAWESREIDPVELRWPSLEACEVHSMGMEFLAYPYYEEFFTPEDAEKYKQKHLAESILLLPYIAMVDEFQHRIYAGEAKGPEGRAELWENLEEKYNPGMDFSDRPEWKRQRWIRQLHIFRAPFYYIDYAIAQIGAWQLWVQSLKDKEAAMQNYLNLCRLGGSLPLKDFFAVGKLRLPFESGVLQNLMDEVLSAQPLID